jgi:hypothetical protein
MWKRLTMRVCGVWANKYLFVDYGQKFNFCWRSRRAAPQAGPSGRSYLREFRQPGLSLDTSFFRNLVHFAPKIDLSNKIKPFFYAGYRFAAKADMADILEGYG